MTEAAKPAMKPVAVVGAAAICEAGTGWRGLGEAALVTSGGTYVKLPGMPAESPLANPKARKMMSRGAYLAARCLADLLADVTWRRANVGYFLGVGASGGSLDDVTALLDASIVDGQFSLEKFGDAGLAACNPLLAFQLMNNFTLCHGAILEGIGGPNAALFSRGTGTTAALIEAVWAIGSGDCDHALVGGADSATHPVTHAELVREGFVERGQQPAEGAALIALGDGTTGARTMGIIEGAAIAHGQSPADLERCLADTDPTGASIKPIDLVVIASWGPPASFAIRTWVTARMPSALVVDISDMLGDTLAAAPALGWVVALDALVAGHGTHALVVGAGVDGDTGMARIARGDA
jgi:hypothetical protein